MRRAVLDSAHVNYVASLAASRAGSG
jgi:hypothetical protein